MPELTFKGKRDVYAHHMTAPHCPLVWDKKRSCPRSGESAGEGNLIIQGDNLYALKSPLPRYAGKVKCVYIDPPYNTGKEGWIYNDRVNSPMIREWLRASVSVNLEDMERHDKWLCMMWPRLQLLRELLADNGAIFISIDDHEVHNLRHLMDEIFGEKNFIATFSWHSRPSVSNSDLERKFAHYLDEQKALRWWHRVAVRQKGEYYLCGWKQERIWPDFVAMGGEVDGKPHVLVFETKGEHLRGNPDTDYKQQVLETLQDTFNEKVVAAGTMTVRKGPAKGTFQLVFNESEFPKALASLP